MPVVCPHYEVRIGMGITWLIYMEHFLWPGMSATGTFSSVASATSVTEIRDHHHSFRLGMPVNLVYNMSMEVGWFQYGPINEINVMLFPFKDHSHAHCFGYNQYFSKWVYCIEEGKHCVVSQKCKQSKSNNMQLRYFAYVNSSHRSFK